MFITVVEVISKKANARDNLCKLIYTNDLANVTDSETDLQEQLVEWKEFFGRQGLRVRKKTEVR